MYIINKLKILHISQFDDRNDYRLFNISISSKISKGLIRNGHDVINFSYRNSKIIIICIYIINIHLF